MEELLQVLREIRNRMARPGTDFVWSGWDSQAAALAEFDRLTDGVKRGALPDSELDLLFAPTGALQELSIGNGWQHEFLVLAERYDEAVFRMVNRR
jgi:hypothetical protein